ncbi:MSC_0775 family lipoprotein [Mesomycoplasma conjunctivae]|uniref:MSC_0775 family lipoprotein n=1 Tax=Mesomycoplasma conjunctivae TaxID=45361 RepID=UPI003DA51B98
MFWKKYNKLFLGILTPALTISTVVSCEYTNNTNLFTNSTNLELNKKHPYYSIYEPQFNIDLFKTNNLEQFITAEFAKVPYQVQNSNSKLININQDFQISHISQLQQINSNNEIVKPTIENNTLTLDQAKVEIKNFKQNKLANRFIKLNLDLQSLQLKAKQINIDLNNFYYEINYNQIQENNDDTRILDIPITIRYYNADDKQNPYKRENFITIYKQISGFAPNKPKQENINKTKMISQIDYKNKANVSIYRALESLNSKEEIKGETDTLIKTKYLDKQLKDIDLFIVEMPQDSKSKYYLKDLTLGDDLRSILVTIVTTTGNGSNAYSTEKVYKIEGFKQLDQQEVKQLFKKYLQVQLKGGISFLNYDFAHVNKNDFVTNFDQNNFFDIKINILEKSSDTSLVARTTKANISFESKSSIFQDFDIENFDIGVPKFVSLFDSSTPLLNKNQIFSPYNVSVYIPELERRNIGEIRNSINEESKSFLTSGGYKEFRTFYTNDKLTQAVHYGEDVLVPTDLPLKTFAKSKLLGAYYLPNQGPAEGIGTTVVLQVDVKDLEISQETKDKYLRNVDAVVFFFIHLDNNKLALLGQTAQVEQGDKNNSRIATYVKDVSPTNPKELEKNTIFGAIGHMSNNGGWSPHVHIEAYPIRYEIKDGKKVFAEKFLNQKYLLESQSKIRIAPSRIDEYIKVDKQNKQIVQLTKLKAAGVQAAFSKEINLVDNSGKGTKKLDTQFKGYKNRDYTKSIDDLFIEKQALDPNIFFQFRDDKSSRVRLDNLFTKAKQNS